MERGAPGRDGGGRAKDKETCVFLQAHLSRAKTCVGEEEEEPSRMPTDTRQMRISC